jgi:ADP-ribose pyrophosphatase
MSLNLIEKQVIYDGKKVRLELHHLANDAGDRVKKEVIVHPGAVVILPFLDAENILLIRNRRYTVGEILIELPAGTMEKGESPMNAAGRELQEETGHLAGRLKPLGNVFASPGIMTEKMYLFAAYNLEKTRSALEADEEIGVSAVTFDRAIEMIQFGQIKDSKTIATLLMYDRFYRVADAEKVT